MPSDAIERMRSALLEVKAAEDALSAALKPLEGVERREAIRSASAAGVPGNRLAGMLGVSRQRIYELLEDR